MNKLYNLGQVIGPISKPAINSHQEKELFRYQNYSYCIAQPHHGEQLLSLIVQTNIKYLPLLKTFFEGIPNGIAFAQKSEKLYIGPKINEFTTNNISVLCIDRQNNNQIVGALCAICKTKQRDDYHLDPEGIYGKVEAQIFDTLESRISKEKRQLMKIQEMVCVINTTVMKQSVHGKRLQNQMVPLMLKQAKKKKFKFVYFVAANHQLRKRIAGFGFKMIAEVNIKQFQYRGRKYFNNIDKDNQTIAAFWGQL